MADGKMRVGIIGMGVYAAFAHIPQLKALEQIEITAISRRNPERLTMAQKAFDIPQSYTDWRKMLDQVSLDAVVVSTPHHLHYEPTIAALQQGLHVLVEKPMALTSREAWAMVKAAEAAQPAEEDRREERPPGHADQPVARRRDRPQEECRKLQFRNGKPRPIRKFLGGLQELHVVTPAEA